MRASAVEETVLSIADIQHLAKAYNLDLTAHYASTSTSGAPPQPTFLTIHFKDVCPQAWRTLMVHRTQVPVHVLGTRRATGSGATDDQLAEPYARLLAEVNSRRRDLNLSPVFN